MSFGQPLWFWAFALFPLLLALFAQNERRREKLLRQLVAARLQERLAGSVSVPLRRLRFALLLLGLAGVIVSLAQPRLGYTWEQSKRKGRDVIIAIDCSRSMLATDLAPSRLGRAKLAVLDLVGQLAGDRLGLIAFAGSAFLQAPLTIDYGAVLNALGELDTDIIPRGGTNIAAAITEADSAFGKGESDNRCLIIFTDGEELDADGIVAATAQKDRIKIFTVGLGSSDGSLIPIPGENGGTGFVKDENGQIVKSRLDEDRLRKIAEVTGGFYLHLQNGPAEMQHIFRDGLGQMKEQEIDARMSRRPIERYQWPLAAGLVLLVASALVNERKRISRRASFVSRKAAALLILWGAMLCPAQSAWKNPGVERYVKGSEAAEKWQKIEPGSTEKEEARQAARKEFERSYQEFSQQLHRQPESPELNFNLGAAAYKLEKDDEALLAFAKATLTKDPNLRVDAESNLANTLYQKGRKKVETDKQAALRDWKDGLKHYDDALQVQPNNQTVRGYREFLRQKIEELEKEPPKSEPQQQQENKDDQKKDKQDQQQEQQQQSKDGQKNEDQTQKQQKDQQQKDQQSQDSQGEQPQKQQQSGSQQDKDQQSKNQEGKEGQDGKNDPAQQQDVGKGDQKKDAKDNPAQKGQDAPAQQPGQKQEPPAPSPDQTDKKRTGEIQAQGTPPPPGDPQQEAAAEAQAAEEGRMTETQARNLLESLKSEDERVQLLKPGERRQGRALRDW
jgi:Ca-activated chloride channel family protein